MISFEVKNRHTDETQFVAEINCATDTPNKDKLRLAVLWALDNGVSLEDANLEGANLKYTNLMFACLEGANLEDAIL